MQDPFWTGSDSQTPSELNSLQSSLASALSQSESNAISLRDFIFSAWPIVEGGRALAWSWHLDALCLHLEALASGELGKRKLLVNIPPRTSKSTVVTIMFPCWLWTRSPWLQFMFASYSFALSRDHAYKRRTILESDWYREAWPELALSGDRNNIMEMGNTSRGLMFTTSVGGSNTGRGGDYLILDDPNDAEQMESEVQRASALRWIDVTWATRANDLKTVREICIQQRTHTSDVTGHLLKTAPDDWTLLKLPMQFNPSTRCSTPIWADPRTEKGEILDPDRFPKPHLDALALRLGPYFYAGQYDQEPYPLGGGVFKSAWFSRRWSKSKENPGQLQAAGYSFDPFSAFRFAVVDPAVSEKSIGEKKINDPDFTAIFACAAIQTHEGVYLAVLDAIHERLEGPDIIPRLQALHGFWRFSVIGVESVAFQLSLFQYAQRAGLPVREISSKNDPEAVYRIDRDKMARAVGSTPYVSRRLVFLPEYAPWLSEFLAEVCAFPNASHDDFVDVLAYAASIAQKFTGAIDYQPEGERIARRNDDDDELQRGAAGGYDRIPEGFMLPPPR